MIPTPTLAKASEEFSCGVMITASHNPPEFNGIKCIDADGTEMPRYKEEEIEKNYYKKSFSNMAWNQVGSMYPRSGAVD